MCRGRLDDDNDGDNGSNGKIFCFQHKNEKNQAGHVHKLAQNATICPQSNRDIPQYILGVAIKRHQQRSRGGGGAQPDIFGETSDVPLPFFGGRRFLVG